ncbi:MAG: hypothetical protein Q9184_004568 [Pyrenodesmia sp. 2 TL-2023]
MQNGEAEMKLPINLLRGWPNPALLPVGQIKAASAAALSQPGVSTPGLLYGPDPGYEPLRESIAEWLSHFYRLHSPTSPNRICITGGASQNLACLLQVFSDPLHTKFVWQVSPTYFRVCPIFEDNAFHGRLRSVPEDDEGIDVKFLKKRLQEVEDEPPVNGEKPKVYRLPALIIGILKSSTESQRLPDMAKALSAYHLRGPNFLQPIIKDHDAPEAERLQWPAQKPLTSSSLKYAVLPRLVDIDREFEGGTERQGADGFGNTVSNGSFSKIAAPGTRCGWAEGTENGGSASGGAPSQMTSTFMTELLRSGELDNHIFTTLQPAYARRYYSMMEAIERYLLPLGVTLPQSDRTVVGGYFLWFALPKPLLADDVARVAKEEENLIIGQGSLFAVYGDERTKELERQVRVCFSWEEEGNIVQGIERLGNVIKLMFNDWTSISSDDSSTAMAVGKDNS